MVPIHPWITLAIVALPFVGITMGRYPFIQTNQTTIALMMGAALLIIAGQGKVRSDPHLLQC